VDFSIRAESGETRRASIWLCEAASARGMPEEAIWRLDLCMTEALANVIAHGGAGSDSDRIRLHLDVRCNVGGGEAAVTVSNTGAAFNPLSVEPRPRPRTLAELEQPGGHGLGMLRQFSDTLDYSYSEGQNHLTIYVRWNDESAP
jgi:anti-sigma regulatory factor (Ser/Thr protein kinase)